MRSFKKLSNRFWILSRRKTSSFAPLTIAGITIHLLHYAQIIILNTMLLTPTLLLNFMSLQFTELKVHFNIHLEKPYPTDFLTLTSLFDLTRLTTAATHRSTPATALWTTLRLYLFIDLTTFLITFNMHNTTSHTASNTFNHRSLPLGASPLRWHSFHLQMLMLHLTPYALH